jgi:tetratricopeptide (TPR) repeat protein
MNNNLISIVSLVVCFSLSIPIGAETSDHEIMQATCSSESTTNNDHPQHVLENWFTTNQRVSSDEYDQKITEIESNKGVFAYEIVPELIGLGFFHQEQINHAEAAKAFQRALYIIRINDGLYSTRQLPILDRMIESNSTLQEWKKVADSYDMMYWLYRRNYEANDPRQLDTIKRLRRWYIESYNKDTERSLEELFSNAEALYKQALAIMLECTTDKRQALCFWHKPCCTDAAEGQGICPVDRG